MSSFNSFSFQGQTLCFDPLVLPAESADWQDIFNVLALAPFSEIGDDPIANCNQALQGHFTSLSRSGFFPLVQFQGWVSFRYEFNRLHAPALTVAGQLTPRDAASIRSLKIERLDPNWILFRFLAQREARSGLGLCEMCGEPMNGWAQLMKRWRHRDCTTYRWDKEVNILSNHTLHSD